MELVYFGVWLNCYNPGPGRLGGGMLTAIMFLFTCVGFKHL